MSCLTQCELIELAFTTAKTVEAGASAPDHVLSCPKCKQDLEDYRSITESFSSAIHVREIQNGARPCLDGEELAAFVDGVTSKDKKPAIEQHLTQCTQCFGQVVELLQLTRQVENSGESVLEFVVGIAKEGLAFLRRPFEGFQELRLQPVALLGDVPQVEDAKKILSWSQRCGSITLEFTLSRVESDLIELRVQVQQRGGPVKSGRITVRSGEAIVQSEALSDNGTVVLRQLEPISYDLEITTQGQGTVTCSVTLFPMDKDNEA